jgi:hypothetical protein
MTRRHGTNKTNRTHRRDSDATRRHDANRNTQRNNRGAPRATTSTDGA